MNIDYLAQIIRKVDGSNRLGAGVLSEAVVRELWQPIETAPKDGTSVLGCVVLNGFTMIATAQYYEINGGIWMCPNRKAVVGPFTHWMPLPAPPLTTQECGE